MNSAAKRFYDESRDIWGLPQEYKGVELYPIKMKDKKYQRLFFELLTHPKNYIAEKQIIKMSYLKFLLYVISQVADIKNMEDKIVDFLQYITKRKDIAISQEIVTGKTEPYAAFSVNIKIGDMVMTEVDFANLREIILEQNGLSIEYVEAYNPDFEETLIWQQKRSGLTEEDEITIFCALAGVSIDEAGNYSVYQFQVHFERLGLLEQYRLYQPLLTSGQIELKSGNSIQHYSAHIGKKGRYDSVLTRLDSFMEQTKGLILPPPNPNNEKE
jgi:hypothetical protein